MAQREIKFRAWNRGISGEDIPSMEYGVWPHDIDGEFTVISGDSELPDALLMQFLGLKDKNGKEIYEGDIITGVWRWFKVPFEVKWDLYGFRLRAIKDCFEGEVKYAEKDMHIDCPIHIDLCEVIGNIYENEELLTP